MADPTGVDLLRRACAAAGVSPERSPGGVALLDVLDARALRFAKVYLLGLNEKQFPRLSSEQCFIDEADRAAWARGGVKLDRRSDLLGREMLLFYLAATRAPTLVVSYLNPEGSPKAEGRSVFVEQLLDTAARLGLDVPVTRVGPGELVVPAAELASSADAVDTAVNEAFWGGQTSAPALLAWAGAHGRGVLERSAWGILAAHRRWQFAVADEFDGRITAPQLQAQLAHRIPDEWVFTASQFNSFADCPWQFFARHLLGLRELPEPSSQLTPANLGSFCHAVLWRVFSVLRGRHGGPVPLATVTQEELDELLSSAVAEERRRLADVAVYGKLWEIQTAAWQNLLRAYLVGQRTGPLAASATPAYFELAFGAARRGDAKRDPASVNDPLEIQLGNHLVRLAGRIDRVDCISEEASGNGQTAAPGTRHQATGNSNGGESGASRRVGTSFVPTRPQDLNPQQTSENSNDVGNATDSPSSAQPRAAVPHGTGASTDRLPTADCRLPSSWLLNIDYKSGKIPSPRDLAEHRELQLALYAPAVAAILRQPCGGGVYQGIAGQGDRWFARLKPGRNGVLGEVEDFPAQLAGALTAAGGYVDAMRAGRFCLTGRCRRPCEFRRICQYSDARARRKAVEDQP
jgi:RecB family exonuclease